MTCSNFISPKPKCYGHKSINKMMIDDVINFIRNYNYILYDIKTNRLIDTYIHSNSVTRFNN